MKVGSYSLHWPWYREQALDVDTVPLFRTPDKVKYKVDNIGELYDLYSKHDLCRGMIDDLSEAACGQGMYTTVEKVSEKLKKNKSKELCDEFGAEMKLDSIMPRVAKNTLIAGFCPVETKLTADPKKCVLKVVHPRTVAEIETDPATGEVLRCKQKVGNQTRTLEGANLAWFTYGNLANDPRGLSFISSILDILTTLDNATTTVTTIADRYISPITVWKSRLPSATLRAAVQKREQGDAIFLGSLTGDEMKENTVTVIQADPRVPYWEFVENLQTRLYAYGRASNVYMTKNANLASAEKMEDIVARHVASIQREIKRVIEKAWYKPLIELNYQTEVPRHNFGKQPTGVQGIAPAEIINKGLDLGFITLDQYYEILRNLGVRITEALGPTPEELAQKQQQKTQFWQKPSQTQQNPPQMPTQPDEYIRVIERPMEPVNIAEPSLPEPTVAPPKIQPPPPAEGAAEEPKATTAPDTVAPYQIRTSQDRTTMRTHQQARNVGENAGPWGCPVCDYVVLNPMIPHNKIVCPKCGYDNRKEIPRDQIASMLANILDTMKQHGWKIGE